MYYSWLEIKLWSLTHFFLHILAEAMALSLPVRVKRTVKISALQMVNTQRFAPHSSPVINLCHNFDIVHVTLLTLYVHRKLFTDLMLCVLPCAKSKCLLAACVLGAGRKCWVSGDRPTDALVFLVHFRGPLCVEADHHPTPTSASSMSDSWRQLPLHGCSEPKSSYCVFAEYRNRT